MQPPHRKAPGQAMDLNPGSSSCEAIVLTTTPPSHIHAIFMILHIVLSE